MDLGLVVYIARIIVYFTRCEKMKLLLVYRRSIIFKDEEESNEESSSPGSYVLSIRNWINILLGYAPGTKEKRRGIFFLNTNTLDRVGN